VEPEFRDKATNEGLVVEAFGLPWGVTGVCIPSKQLVPLDASTALVVARHDQTASKASVGEPDLASREEPAGLMGPKQVAEAGARIRGGDMLCRHVRLHMDLPEMVVGGVPIESLTCFRDAVELERSEIGQDAGDELGGEGKQTTAFGGLYRKVYTHG
jgi:hypothetical protein